MVKALLLFHLRVGVRVAIRASAPLFCLIVAGVLFQDSPAAFVIMVARATYAGNWSPGVVVPIAAIAILLPAWGESRFRQGLSGWMRHLPLTDGMNRIGLWLALICVQMPLAVMLALLGLIAARLGLPVGWPAVRWALVLAAGAAASLPAGRARRPRSWRQAGVHMSWHIAWRAVGLRIIPAVAAGLAMIAVCLLFISNNDLQGTAAAAAAARLGGSMACALSLCGLCNALAARRPAWPFARSFPWSALDRIVDDSLFFAIHAVPFVLSVLWISPVSALAVLSVVPFMSVRAAEYVRQIPERRAALFGYLGETAFAAAVLTLVPWSAFFWLLVTVWALRSAAESERRLKSTDWFELHHESAGDTSAWSAS